MSMKRLFLLGAGLLLAAGPALAGESMTGVVARADPWSGELTLLGGTTVQVADPRLLRNLAPGERVIVTLNDTGTIGVQKDNAYVGSGNR